MGIWGNGILENDTTKDIWSEFKELFDSGLSPGEIRLKLEEEYAPDSEDEEYSMIWTGIAYGQWMSGGLELYTIDKVEKCINELKGITLWSSDDDSIQERLSVLRQFIEKIRVPKEKTLKRNNARIPCPSFFKKGDVISIKLDNAQYTIALIVNDTGSNPEGKNSIIFSDYVSQEKPTLRNFFKSNVMYFDIGGKSNYFKGYFTTSFFARNMKKKINQTELVGQISINELMLLRIGTPFGYWQLISELYNEQIEFLRKNKTESPQRISFRKLLKGRNTRIERKLIEHDKQNMKKELERVNATQQAV